MRKETEGRLARLAALGEPVRRALYRFVSTQPAAVSRDQAATGVGVPRHVAKFHLDRLEADGLLEAEFRRPPGRGGPGAGRPSKLYKRSKRELSVSLPERRYELAGRLMAEAITRATHEGVAVEEALGRAATELGQALGEEARERAGEEPSSEEAMSALTEVLDENGYEPRMDEGKVTLVNCPFHALAQDYTDLVCGMNLEIVGGLIEGLPAEDLEARLEPAPDRCCVTICERRRG